MLLKNFLTLFNAFYMKYFEGYTFFCYVCFEGGGGGVAAALGTIIGLLPFSNILTALCRVYFGGPRKYEVVLLAQLTVFNYHLCAMDTTLRTRSHDTNYHRLF